MDAAPSSARGVSEELAPVPRVAAAADDAGWAIRPPAEICCWMERFFSAAEAATSRWDLLILAMELMMGEEPIASERGECSSNGYELEWTSMYCAR
jgi:hypothetical protein